MLVMGQYHGSFLSGSFSTLCLPVALIQVTPAFWSQLIMDWYLRNHEPKESFSLKLHIRYFGPATQSWSMHQPLLWVNWVKDHIPKMTFTINEYFCVQRGTKQEHFFFFFCQISRIPLVPTVEMLPTGLSVSMTESIPWIVDSVPMTFSKWAQGQNSQAPTRLYSPSPGELLLWGLQTWSSRFPLEKLTAANSWKEG